MGPTFAFGVTGKLAGERRGEASLALVESILEVQKKLVVPVAMFTQPVSGVALVFLTGRFSGFFRREWLWIAIVLYVIVLVIAFAYDNKVVARIIEKMRARDVESPEFHSLVRKTTVDGILMGAMIVAIIFLMIFKPGDAGTHIH